MTWVAPVAVDVVVMECPRCGRLWVGTYEEADTQHSFSERELHQLTGTYVHAVPEPLIVAENGYRTRCQGVPESVRREEVMAAFLLAGKEAAEALADGALQRAINAPLRSNTEQARGT